MKTRNEKNRDFELIENTHQDLKKMMYELVIADINKTISDTTNTIGEKIDQNHEKVRHESELFMSDFSFKTSKNEELLESINDSIDEKNRLISSNQTRIIAGIGKLIELNNQNQGSLLESLEKTNTTCLDNTDLIKEVRQENTDAINALSSQMIEACESINQLLLLSVSIEHYVKDYESNNEIVKSQLEKMQQKHAQFEVQLINSMDSINNRSKKFWEKVIVLQTLFLLLGFFCIFYFL